MKIEVNKNDAMRYDDGVDFNLKFKYSRLLAIYDAMMLIAKVEKHLTLIQA